jgi:parallel beta-helix repeat protein
MTSTPRRLAALTFGVTSLAAVALAGPVAAADGGSQQFVTTTTTPAQAEAQQSHVDQDKLGISAMNHAVRGKSEPFIYADPGSVRPTLMLPAAAAPYDVAQLATKFTSAFSTLPGGGLLLDIPLEVADGATLRIDSATTPVFDLRSGDKGYAFVAGIHATIELSGTAATPLHIGSYDPSTGRADQALANGRAYVAAEGSHMVLDHVEAADLGFFTGTASGMAWLPYGGVDASGSITSSSLTGNYFGAYSSNTTGFRVADSQFTDSTAYGFDLHDHAQDATITGTTATGNGSHGFNLNRGCTGTIIRDTSSSGNGGVGFLINANRSSPGHPSIPSSRNTLENVTASSNSGAGILIHSGTANVVRSSTVAKDHGGIIVVGQAKDTIVDANTVRPVSGPGIEISAGSTGAVITDNTVASGSTGILSNMATPTTITGNTISHIQGTGLKLNGDEAGFTLSDNSISGTGASPIYLNGEPTTKLDGATVHRWDVPGVNWWIRPLELSLWILILAPPLLLLGWGRRRRSKVRAAKEATS